MNFAIDIEKAIQSGTGCSSIKENKITRNHKTRGKRKRALQLQLKEQLETTLQKIEKLSKDVETLKDFDREKLGHQENKRVKLEKEKQKEALEGKQQEIGKELEIIVELQNQWNQTYLEWKLTTEQNIKEIAIFIEDSGFSN